MEALPEWLEITITAARLTAYTDEFEYPPAPVRQQRSPPPAATRRDLPFLLMAQAAAC